MNNEEAKSILEEILEAYERQSYQELLRLLGPNESDTFEVMAPSGTNYQVEIQAIWDDKPTGVLRIIGSVDDGTWRAFLPLTESFLVEPQTC